MYYANQWLSYWLVDQLCKICAMQHHAICSDFIISMTYIYIYTYVSIKLFEINFNYLTSTVEKEQREIQIWVANAQNSSFLSMAIKGQQMYRWVKLESNWVTNLPIFYTTVNPQCWWYFSVSISISFSVCYVVALSVLSMIFVA